MNVRTSSIQYRMVDMLFTHPSNNLCVYFWQCVLSWSASLLALVSVLSTAYVGYALTMGETLGQSKIALLFVVPGVSIWVVILCVVMCGVLFGILYVAEMVVNRVKHLMKLNTSNGGSTASITSEYINAKKDKFCPKIEFIDEPQLKPTNPPKRK